MSNQKGSGNFSNLKGIRKDDEGNILSCPKCGSFHLIKQGTDGRRGLGAPKRWKCKQCNYKTAHPKQSTAYELLGEKEEPEWTTEELLNHREDTFLRRQRRENNEDFLDIGIKDKKPIGLYIMGDPHIDDDGCDIPALRKHINIVNQTEGMYSCNVGDLQNNWATRTKLAELWKQQSTTAEQAWQLTEWLCLATNWIFIVAGNHDVWSGAGDPLKWICRPLKTTYRPYSIRVRLKLPKHNVRIHCAHQFRGNSIYNTAHAIVKEAMFGFRDHLLIAGHTHVSGYMPMREPNSGIIQHCTQVGSYKKYDQYAKQNMMHNKMLSPCACAVFDTNLPDTHPDFIKIFWDLEAGTEYLNYLRSRK
jgi:hypothetical protein